MKRNTHNMHHDRDFLTTLLTQWRKKLRYFSILAAVPAIIGTTTQDTFGTEELVRPVSAPSVAGRLKKRAKGLSKFFGKAEFLQRQTGTLDQRFNERFESAAGLLTGSDNCPGTPVAPGVYSATSPFTDTGDTTGSNTTVNHLFNYYYYGYNVSGPDHIYSFTLTSRGPNAEIRITPNSATFNPVVYLLRESWSPCPSSTGSTVYNWWSYISGSGPGGAEVLDSRIISLMPLNSPMFLFIDSAEASNAGPYTLTMKDVGIASGTRSRLDFVGSPGSDIAVYRPSDSTWYMRDDLGSQFNSVPFGLPTDKIVPGNYDDDSRTDIAVYRDGTWWWIASASNTVNAVQFGQAGDVPVPADFTGDGRTDLAIYRGGNWWIYDLTTAQYRFAQFGLPGDRPVVADYDGDGLSDIAVFRDGTWYMYRSRTGLVIIPFGLAGDQLVPEDYDGDGKSDPAVYRNGIWYAALSSSGIMTRQFGLSTDIPVPFDIHGNGRANLAVFRDGYWFVSFGTSNTGAWQFGLPGDVPLAGPR